MERVKQKLAMPEKEFEKVCVICQTNEHIRCILLYT